MSLFSNPREAFASLSADLQPLLANPCNIATSGAGKIPFICFDLAGGANISGSNVLVGQRDGQMDFLNTSGYEKLGLPGDMVPGLNDPIRAFATGNFLACIGVFLERGIYSEYRFDTNPLLPGSEDWEFWLRVGADHRIDRLTAVNSAIVEHSGRTMHNQDITVATRRVEYILSKVDSDPHLSSVYGPYRSLMRASRMVFLAGIANDNQDSKAAMGFLRRAVAERPTMSLSPRFIRCMQIAAGNWLHRRQRVER